MPDRKQNYRKNTWGLKGLFFSKCHKNHLMLGILRSHKGDSRGNILKAINKRQQLSLLFLNLHISLRIQLQESLPKLHKVGWDNHTEVSKSMKSFLRDILATVTVVVS